MFKRLNTDKRALLKYALGFSLAWLSILCAPNQDFRLQKIHPQQTVDLPGILERLPAIATLIESLDLAELDALSKMSAEIEGYEIEETIKSFMRLSEMLGEPLPRVLNVLAPVIRLVYERYLSSEKTFNLAFSSIKDLLNIDAEAAGKLIEITSEFVYKRGSDIQTFPENQFYPFPGLSTVKNCNESYGGFASALRTAKFARANADRDDLLALYTNLRPLYCGFQSASGSVAENLGPIIYQVLVTLRNDNPDPENDLLAAIDRIENHFSDVESDEEELVEWLGHDENKTIVADFFSSTLFEIVQNETLFSNEMLSSLEVFSALLSQKDEFGQEFLISEIAAAINIDIKKLPVLDTFLANKVGEISIVKITDDILSNSTSGFGATFARYGGGNLSVGKSKTMELLWDGRTYDSNANSTVGSPYSPTTTTFTDGLFNA